MSRNGLKCPYPPILAFLVKKQGAQEEIKKDFRLCWTLKFLEKRAKKVQKNKEDRKTQKSKEIEKKRIEGSK